MSLLRGAISDRDTDGEVALFREGLQKAHYVACERSANTKRWRGCRKLHRLAAIDAVGYGVIRAAARDGRSCDREFGAATAALNGELHRGAVRAVARRS